MDKNIIKESIEYYGEDKQLIVAMEECSELIQAVSKELRGKSDPTHLAEEIADVLISIEIIKDVCHISDRAINAWIKCKQDRIVEIMRR